MDFDRLVTSIKNASRVVTCQAILAEVSNHLDVGKTDAHRRPSIEQFDINLPTWRETHIPVADVARDPAFLKLGLTDAVILAIAASEKCAILTSDSALWVEAQKRKLPAVNFNHGR